MQRVNGHLRTVLAGLALVSAVSVSAQAEVRLPKIFSSHMVLQRDVKLPVWGWADPGEKVQVSLGDQTAEATADDDGKWKVSLPAQKAGGPHEITVKGSKSEPIGLTDILVGEVWLCSGQSNMAWSVSRSNNPKEEIAAANYPKIRLFNVPRRPSATPIDDIEAKWEVCSPKTIPNFTAVGYFFGRHLHKELDVPIGLISSSWGGTRIEPWTPVVGFEAVEKTQPIAKKVQDRDPKGKYSHQDPTMLYNGMIKGFVPFALQGAIWYQGESNHREGALYRDKMEALIKGWREVFHNSEMPFLFVQLAPYQYGTEDPTILAKAWEAQTESLKIPHTGMAVTTDIANLKDIHPKNKQDVGKRLALWALATTYGQDDLVYSGPLYKSSKVEDGKIRVMFDHVGSGLASRDGEELTWFQIAGEDGGFVDAQAKIDGDTVVVWSDEVKAPKSVRFGFHKLAEPNLMNKDGLPASPFRTDSD
ncbi:sialate O-acetylesterase [Thalassoroseus pseudoceratinae]|uniref:sialate O-acetylesterase n=1 Tax=Thalassoroseus pseudoceratinae TaxID=2713176 RepID=UPI00141EEC8D|nr:sialate O-acetylesterase [Thalassoroseus pseudoceratinae]